MTLVSISFRTLILCTLSLGLLYPFSMYLIGQLLFSNKVSGSLLLFNDQVIGSKLIAQKFTDPKYFWPRPSAVDYNPQPSGATNLGPTSKALRETISQRRIEGLNGEMLFASGSGLDPHISPATALSQIERIAVAREYDDATKKRLYDLVRTYTELRQYGVFGEPRVNVLLLNLELNRGI